MSFFSEKNIGKLIFLNSSLSILVLGAAMIIHSIIHFSERYDQEIAQIEQEFVEQKKTEAGKMVDLQISRINSRHKRTTQLLKESLQENVHQVDRIAAHLYEQNSDRLQEKELRSLIAEALRFHTFNREKGYLFMWGMDGTCLLYPPDPKWEGKNVRISGDDRTRTVFAALRSIAADPGEGFYSYQWPKPGDTSGETFQKISYISYFEPLDCYIGSGEYLEDFNKNLKQTIINTLNNAAAKVSAEYFFILDLHDIDGGDNFATMLVNPNRPDLLGKKLSDSYKDARGKEFRKEFLKGLREQGEAFVRYWYKKPNMAEPQPKMSYFKFYQEWNWILAQGFYFDDLDRLIAAKKEKLKQKIKNQIFHSVLILALFLIITVALSFLFSKKINGLFQDYRQSLEKKNRELSLVNLSLANEIKIRKKAQDEIAESYTELDQVFNVAVNGMVKISTEYKIEMVNDTFTRMVRLDEGEIIGRNCFDILKSDLCLSAECPLRILAKDGKNFCRTIEPGMYGLQISAILTSAPLYNKQGKFYGIIEDFYDLSEIKEKEQELEHFRRMVEQTGDGIALADMTGTILYVNRAWAIMHGYNKAKELMGIHLNVFHTDEQIENEVLPFNGKVIELGEYSGEVGHKRKDNSLFPCLMTTTILADDSGKQLGFIGMARDISEIVNAREEARQANQAKSEFLANMSHEIRTPMNAIIVMTSLLLEDSLSDEQRSSLTVVKKSADALLCLINDILDFSKIEAGKLELEESHFRPERLIRETVQSCTVLAEGKGLSIITDIPVNLPAVLIGDPLRLRQIFLNLLNNAIKFTKQGSISVSGKVLSKDNDTSCLQFLVSDSGIGMSPEVQERIFHSFSQADSSISREFGGTGLGLSISRDLVALMGGSLSVESKEGKGSIFEFTISFKIGIEQALPKEIELDHDDGLNLPPLDILVVDDVEENRLVASMVLEKYKQRVQTAKNGLEAMKMLADNNFDVVLMDLQMPVMNGLTAIGHIRSCERGDIRENGEHGILLKKLSAQMIGGHLPIVGLTADAFAETREKCLNQGMDECLTKPFKPSEVILTLARLIEMEDKEEKAGKGDHEEKLGTTSASAIINRVTQHLQKIYKLQPEQINQMLATSAKTMAGHLEQISRALETEDLKKIKNSAHGLKGGLLNLGLDESAELALKMEQAAKNGERGSYEEWHNELCLQLAELIEYKM